jgi:hypothetical protein
MTVIFLLQAWRIVHWVAPIISYVKYDKYDDVGTDFPKYVPYDV